jgi:hypothetical protein
VEQADSQRCCLYCWVQAGAGLAEAPAAAPGAPSLAPQAGTSTGLLGNGQATAAGQRTSAAEPAVLVQVAQAATDGG